MLNKINSNMLLGVLFEDDWPFSKGFCEMTGFLGNLCNIAAVFNLMMVSIDR